MLGLSSYMKTSAVANVSGKFSGMNEPVPTTSRGARQFANILHLNRLNPEEPTIFAALKQLDHRGDRDARAEQNLSHAVLDDVQAVGVERLLAHHVAHRLVLVGNVQPADHDIH